MKRHLIEIILLFLAFYLPGFFFASPSDIPLTRYMLQYLLLALPQILLIVYILRIQGEPPLDRFGLTRARISDFGFGFLLFGGLIALFLTFSYTLTLLPQETRRILVSGYRWESPPPAQIPLILIFSLVTGYREEIFFRSYLITRFGGLGLAPVYTVGVSSILFALGHVYQGPAAALFAFLQGVGFSIFFLRRRTLHGLALAHALYNFTILLLSPALLPA